MINPFAHLSFLQFKRLPQLFLIAAVTAVGLVIGSAPSPLPLTGAIGNAAFAQEAISNEDVQNYARSVLRIEPIRQSAYDEIKRITGADVPSIACHRPNSLNNLSRNIRQIAINYCNQSIEIVESNNLTIGRFNTITTAIQSDPDLAARIQQALIRLQETGN